MSGPSIDPKDARSIPRLQARRLVLGGGRYVADIASEGSLHVAFVRSPFPAALVRGVEVQQALRTPGVRGVFTLRDLRAMGAGALRVGWVLPGQRATEVELMAGDRVRFVGDPVAVVVADSMALAEEAAELVSVDYEPSPAVSDVDRALEPGSPLVHPEWGDNRMASAVVESGDADAAFSAADVVVSERFRVGRSAAMPLEPRGVLASYDGFTGEITLVSSTQSPHHVRADLAECLGRDERSIRVIAPDVGGSFGAKDHASAPEAVCCALAMHLRRPVRWIETRSEHVASTGHSREQTYDVELAADGEGRILGMRGRLLFDAGAYASSHGMGTAIYSAALLPSVYRFSDYRLEAIAVMTNKAPSGAYRGYGAPEAAFVIESLVDALARRIGIDPVEVRRRNVLSRDELPYRTASGCVYDQADYPRVMDLALKAAGYESFRSDHPFGRTADADGEGIGVACTVLMGGFGSSREAIRAGMSYGGYETALVRMDAEAKVSVLSGLPTQGQGIDTALAQVCAARLGLDPGSDVTVVAGDTAMTPASPVGPVGSRGVAVGGSAVDVAAGRVAEDVRRAAAAMLEASPDDIELQGARAFVRGAPDRGFRLDEVAAAIKRGELIDQGVDPTLEATASFDPPDFTYSFSVHVARVRVDAATGAVAVTGYATASDCGTLINPAIVRGQIEGAVIQGIGGALLQEQVDDPIKSPEQAERMLATPALGAIPPSGIAKRLAWADRWSISIRSARLWSALRPGAAVPPPRDVQVEPAARVRSAFGESFRYLRTNLILLHKRLPRTLLVTSPGNDAAKDVVGANLAIALAQARLRVWLVDADLRKQSLTHTHAFHPAEAAEGSGGLAEWLGNDVPVRDLLRATAIQNLSFLPAGTPPSNPAELLGSPKMRAFLQQDRDDVDIVVLVAPPVLPVADAAVLAPEVDGVLLAVRVGVTPGYAARKAQQHLDAVGGRLLGVVVTDVSTDGLSRYYSAAASYHEAAPRDIWYLGEPA